MTKHTPPADTQPSADVEWVDDIEVEYNEAEGLVRIVTLLPSAVEGDAQYLEPSDLERCPVTIESDDAEHTDVCLLAVEHGPHPHIRLRHDAIDAESTPPMNIVSVHPGDGGEPPADAPSRPPSETPAQRPRGRRAAGPPDDGVERHESNGSLDEPDIAPPVPTLETNDPAKGVFVGIGVEQVSRQDGEWKVDPVTGFITGKVRARASD